MSEHELGWKHLAFARVYATDFANFPDFNAVWEALFNAIEVPPPARSSVGVNALPLNAAIEIEFTFYKE